MIRVLPVPVPDITDVSKPAISAKAAQSWSSLGTIVQPLSTYIMRDAFKTLLCAPGARELRNWTEGVRSAGILLLMIDSRVSSAISRTPCTKA